jgi:glutamate formiminotransferase
MNLSWISNRSLRISPRARLVADGEAEALRRKLEQIEWRPENGFLKDQFAERASSAVVGSRAA